MMADRPEPGQPDPAGLCATCRFAEAVVSARGSRFLLCLRSKTDPDFPKYPRLPVLRCRGYEFNPLG